MKKIFISSLCALALINVNVLAQELENQGSQAGSQVDGSDTEQNQGNLEDYLAQKEELEKKLKEEQEKFQGLNNTYVELNKELENKKKAHTEAQNNHKTQSDIVGSYNSEYESYNGKYSTLEKEITSLTQANETYKIQLEENKKNIETLTTQLSQAKDESYQKYEEFKKVSSENHPKLEEINNKKKPLIEKQEKLEAEISRPTTSQNTEEYKKLLKELTETKNEIKKLDTEAQTYSDKIKTAQNAYWQAYNKAENLSGQKDKTEKENKKLENNIKYNQEDITNKTQEKTILNEKISQIQTKLDQAKKDLESKKQIVDEALKSVNAAKENIDKIQDSINTARNDVEKAQKELDDLINEIKNNTEEGKETTLNFQQNFGQYYDDNSRALNELIVLKLQKGDKWKDEQAKAQNLANEVANEIIKKEEKNINANATSGLNIQINNMNKRLGEVRGLNGEAGVWLRGYGGKYSSDAEDFHYYSTQFGADKFSDLSNGRLLSGALISFDKVNATTQIKGYGVGMYFSYMDNSGFFTDLVVKYLRNNYEQTGHDFKNQNSFLASFEGGYRYEFNSETYIEPSLEFITGYVGKYEDKHANTTISLDSYAPLVFKPQVFVGKSINDFTLRAGIGGVFNVQSNDAQIYINDILPGLNAQANQSLGKNNHGFVSIGTSYTIKDNLRLNLGLERSFGGDLTNDYELNAVIRYSF